MYEFMKHSFIFLLVSLVSYQLIAQTTDSLTANRIVVHQDYRMDILARKESDD